MGLWESVPFLPEMLQTSYISAPANQNDSVPYVIQTWAFGILPSRPRHTSVALPQRPLQVTNSPPWPHGRNFDDFATIVALCRTPNVKGLQTAVSVYLLGSNLN